MSTGYCAKCREHSAYLMPLHGEKGGAMCCLTCVGAWHAEHGRRRNRGRVVIRAMKGFLDAGGSAGDLDKLKLTAMVKDVLALDIDPLGYLHGVGNTTEEVIELTLELLDDVLTLVHPDKQPPERRDLAQRVTAQLLAIKPFVFPALKPKAKVPKPNVDRNTSMMYPSGNTKEVLHEYPCPTCRSIPARLVQFDYCDACLAEWRRRQDERHERESAKNRQKYALRRQRQLRHSPQRRCAQCGKMMSKHRRRHVKFCSVGCRVRAHRVAVKEDNYKWEDER